MDWTRYDAVLFDLDGVVTPTAIVHMRAWSEMFNEFLRTWQGEGDTSPYADADYYDHVDGKPRYDGVRDFLTSRGIPATEGLVIELGDRKNDAFNEVLERDGVEAYPGSVLLLDHLRSRGTPLGVVSSSANAPAVLEAAGLLDRFDAVCTSSDVPRPKPAPDVYLLAASTLQVAPARCLVLEDSPTGVRAALAAGMLVILAGTL